MISYEKLKNQIEEALLERKSLIKRKGLLLFLNSMINHRLHLIEEDLKNGIEEDSISLVEASREEDILDEALKIIRK